MKIKSLLISNLASFKGEHFFDFSKGQMADNLFIIWGPTGSGKSTILAAVGLALYGKHYKTQITQKDLITLGASQGSVELEFIYQSKTYRAVWQCKLAKQDGSLLKIPKTGRFLYLDDKLLEITAENLFQLSFDQFCKTVILNQGEFSRFLLSSFTERKVILEKLIHSRLLGLFQAQLKETIKETQIELDSIKKQRETLFLYSQNQYELWEKELDHLQIYRPHFNQGLKQLNALVQIISRRQDQTKRLELLKVQLAKLGGDIKSIGPALERHKGDFFILKKMIVDKEIIWAQLQSQMEKLNLLTEQHYLIGQFVEKERDKINQETKDQQQKLQRFQKLESSLNELKKQKQELDLSHMPKLASQLSSCLNQVNQLEQLCQNLTSLAESIYHNHQALRECDKKLNHWDQQISQFQDKINSLKQTHPHFFKLDSKHFHVLNELLEMAKKNEHCPLCGGHVTENDLPDQVNGHFWEISKINQQKQNELLIRQELSQSRGFLCSQLNQLDPIFQDIPNNQLVDSINEYKKNINRQLISSQMELEKVKNEMSALEKGQKRASQIDQWEFELTHLQKDLAQSEQKINNEMMRLQEQCQSQQVLYRQMEHFKQLGVVEKYNSIKNELTQHKSNTDSLQKMIHSLEINSAESKKEYNLVQVQITQLGQSIDADDILLKNSSLDAHFVQNFFFAGEHFHLTTSEVDAIGQQFPSEDRINCLAYLQELLNFFQDKKIRLSEVFYQLTEKVNEYKKRLTADEDLKKQLQDIDENYQHYLWLNETIGLDGLRNFVLSMVEMSLLKNANWELSRLCDGRYELIQKELYTKGPKDFFVVDKFQSGQLRKVTTLSGGETFLVALSLALGLSEMTRGHTQIDCFFIDEGFGALDPDSLDDALEILLELQCRGKQVGIVSHVHELFERIDSHLQLEKNGVGESRLIEH